jgi:hypothetical protein
MANKIKRNLGIDSDSINIGEWSVGIDGAGMGPTSATEFFNGIEIPEGGYAIYSGNISVRIAADDTELVHHLNKLGAGVPVNDRYNALLWAKANNVLVLNKTFESIVTDALVFNLDARQVTSFPENIPTVNLVTDTPSTYGWAGGYTVIDSASKTFTIETRQNNAATTSAWRTFYWNVSEHIGSYVTISADVQFVNEENCNFRDLHIGQGNTGSYPYHIAGSEPTDKVRLDVKPYEPVHLTWTGIINETGIVGFTQWIHNVTVNGANSILKLTNVQIEAKSFETPFVNGVRNQHSEWYDVSGFNRTASKNGNPTFNSDGYWEFRNVDGDGDYEYFTASFDEGVLKAANTTGEWSIEALWRDMGSALGSENIIVGRVGHHGGILQRDSGGSVYAQIRTDAGGSGQAWIGGGTTTDGKWTHALMTYNNRVTKLYIDGVLKGTHTMSTNRTVYNHNNTFYIGGYPNNKYRSYTDIAVARAYSKQLSESEVLQNYYGAPIVTDGLVFAVDAGNLVSYEPGSNIVADFTGNNSNGTLLNGAYGSGNWFVFDGNNDELVFPHNSVYKNQEISVDFWINLDYESGGRHVMFTSWYGFTVEINNPSGVLTWGLAGLPSQYMGVGTIEYGKTYHVSCTYNPVTNIQNGYINGKLLKTQTVDGNINYSSSELIFSGSWDRTKGKMGCMKIYNKELTQEEVLQNYNAQITKFK